MASPPFFFFSLPPAGNLQASFLLLLSTCLLDFTLSTMGVPDNNLDGLERQRRELEGNVLKLQQSLYHWRTWEAEYDGLKEEISELDDNATTDEFLRIGRDFGGGLVNEEEVKVILGAKQGVTRSKEQAVNLISRRIDYVKENTRTIERRLRTAEDNLHALDSIGQARPETTEADFPMTEIMEELDEEGNVVSSSMQTPGSQAPELLDILKKAGVNDIPKAPQTDTKSPSQQSRIEEITEDDSEADEPKEKGASTPRESMTTTSQQTKKTSRDHQLDRPKPTPAPEPRSKLPEERPVTDVDESPEDAELRREMLQYGIDEVGAVVAELELDETGSDASFDDSYAYDYDDDENEDEDEFGRDTRPALSEEYHKQMRELEEKLNARGMWNMGKHTNTLSNEMKQDLDEPQMVKVEKADDKNGKPKKKVAFAEDVDIAPPAAKPASEKKNLPPQQPEVAPMSDSIVERAESAAKSPATPEPPKKASRFKSARSGMGKNTSTSANSETAAPPPTTVPGSRPPEVRSTAHKTNNTSSSPLPLFPAKPAEPKPFSQPIPDVFDLEKTSTSQTQSQPRPPSDKITADKLVERDIKEGNAAAPQLNDVDDQLHAKEIASEFYRMRNRAIQQSGGFLNDEEPETVPLETEDAPKRVSKFKAARMK